eukprot:Gb_30602 [translate_table: standard]
MQDSSFGLIIMVCAIILPFVTALISLSMARQPGRSPLHSFPLILRLPSLLQQQQQQEGQIQQV